jgi:mannose-1-phosphate guanylyltransferase
LQCEIPLPAASCWLRAGRVEVENVMSAQRLSAVVLAGTHHWNGSGFERLAPRPLLPVAGSPLIAYSLRWLRAAGVRRVAVCGNGTTPALEAALGDGRELDLELGYHQDPTPRGPAGCVRDAVQDLGWDALVVASGTAIPTVDLAGLLAFHEATGAALTAVAHAEPSAAAPPTPGGVYVFARRALDHVAAAGFQDIKEGLIPRLHRAGERVLAYPGAGCCPQVVDAQTYLAVNEWVLERLGGGDLHHPSARVDPGACLVGPVRLGRGVRVEAGATIVGPTSIGAETRIAQGALVARSALWSRCVVEAGAVVHGCVVGDDAAVPAGSRLFNVVREPLSAAPGRLGISWWPARTPAPPPAERLRRPLTGTLPTSCTIG